MNGTMAISETEQALSTLPKKIVLITLLVVMTSSGFAQGFSAALWNFEQVLNDQCVGGNPLPDNRVVKIFWDTDSDGPDDIDPICPVGSGENQFNFNSFEMNGEEFIGTPGTFFAEELFQSSVNFPSPSRYYLRICVSETVQWVSGIFIPVAGFNEFYFGTPGGTIPLTCVTTRCPCTSPPSAPTDFSGPDTVCTSVQLTWAGYIDHECDILEIFRGDGNGLSTHLAFVSTGATTYTDNDPLFGYNFYGLVALKICAPADTGRSEAVEEIVYRRPGLLTATITAVTTNLCDSVRVTFRNPPNIIGIFEFRVKRNGVQVGTIGPGIAGQSRTISVAVAQSDTGSFTILSFGTCGDSSISNAMNGFAMHTPAQVVGVSATDGSCNITMISWNDLPNETSYQILRDETLIATNAPNDIDFIDIAGAAGTVFQYSVRAFNICGPGPLSISDNGFRIICNGIEAQFAGVPEEFYLSQNYPNPFNPVTNIEFGLPKFSDISIEIYDISGRLIANLLDGKVEPGVHMITWDCSECGTGIYLLRLVTEEQVFQRKMFLIK